MTISVEVIGVYPNGASGVVPEVFSAQIVNFVANVIPGFLDDKEEIAAIEQDIYDAVENENSSLFGCCADDVNLVVSGDTVTVLLSLLDN